ncbi:TonB family protein [Candidatus Kirkpatrickella diaphorinae]|uniref:TonB family protein n=1 Tax=Candidatus Kirkpatrickella diaphorinae TaxID=2984322 RepID=A0ABY6GI32_9PROT|nr:TonB family protein [Candidatus Kirkpatrickella diaphorinae]UYH51060.1 TonB family protein [Candidatus Kirkpatrickella diaphorinae]
MPRFDETCFSAWHMRHVANARRHGQRRWLSSLLMTGGAMALALALSLIVLKELAETKGDASETQQPIQISLVSAPAPPRLLDPGPLTLPNLAASTPISSPRIPAPETSLQTPPLAVPKFRKLRENVQRDPMSKLTARKKMSAPPAEKATAPPASENAADHHDLKQATASNGAQDNWMGRVYARLKAYRRYPNEARSAGIEGKVGIWFTFDRTGHVVTSGLAKSSGDEALDEAAIALPKDAEPIPLPPDPDRLTYPYRLMIRIGYKLR